MKSDVHWQERVKRKDGATGRKPEETLFFLLEILALVFVELALERGERELHFVQLLLGVGVVLVEPVKQIEAILACRVHHGQQRLVPFGVNRRALHIQISQHPARRVRQKLRARGELVVLLATHFHHRASFSLPNLEKHSRAWLCARGNAYFLKHKRQVLPRVAAGLWAEHWVCADDVGRRREERQEKLFWVRFDGKHVHHKRVFEPLERELG
mmetsp:Transcript_15600/g.33646  ORF Transcript_15600/g.33646 Transcript_15600/m.33646 type:complete len:213 (+) Transcript_15600:667-1305(+)